MGTAPKKRAATSAKKATKKKSATKKASSKKVTKKPASKKTSKKASKKKPLRPEMPQFPTSITLRNRVSLALLSPYRLPLDSQTMAMNVARASGFAFVILGAFLASYNALSLANTTSAPTVISFAVPAGHSQLAQVINEDTNTATTTESENETQVNTSTTTSTTTSEADTDTEFDDTTSTTTQENFEDDGSFDEEVGVTDNFEETGLDIEYTDAASDEGNTVTLETNNDALGFVTNQMLLVFSSIIVVIIGLVLIIIGLYIHRKQLKERVEAAEKPNNDTRVISPSTPPSPQTESQTDDSSTASSE